MKQVGHLFARDVFWTTLASGSQSFSTFLLVALFMKLGGSEKYGIWALLIAISGIVGPIVSLRLSTAMVRLLAGVSDLRQREQSFLAIFFVTLLIALITSISLANWEWFIKRVFGDTTNLALVQVGLFFIVSQALELVILDAFRTFNRLKAYAITTILRTGLMVLVVFSFLFLKMPFIQLISAAVALRLIIVLGAAINIYFFENMSFNRFLTELDLTFLPAYLAYAFPMLLDGFFTLVLHSGDRLILGYFTDVSTVGIYSAAYTIGSLAVLLIAPIQMSLYSSISRFWNTHQYSAAKSYIKLSLEFYVLLAIPLTIGISLMADLILTLLASEQTAQSGSLIVPVVAVGIFFYGIHSIALLVITLSKRVWSIAFIGASSGILNTILNILFIGHWNWEGLGAAFATLSSLLLMATSSSLVAHRELKVSLEKNFVLKVAAAALLMALILYLLPGGTIWKRSLAAFGGVIAYFLLLTFTEVIPYSPILQILSSYHSLTKTEEGKKSL